MAISTGFPGCSLHRELSQTFVRSCPLTHMQLLIVGMFFLPESPRHLIATDRDEEGLRILRKLHYDGTNGMST